MTCQIMGWPWISGTLVSGMSVDGLAVDIRDLFQPLEGIIVCLEMGGPWISGTVLKSTSLTDSTTKLCSAD